MRPSRRASVAAWFVVALVACGYAAQLWPEHRDPDGFRSHIGVVG